MTASHSEHAGDDADAFPNESQSDLTVPHGASDCAQRNADEWELERMPKWVHSYLAAWGSKPPDGGRMTVTWAAEFAGTNPDTVRQYRRSSAAFRRLEDIARHGSTNWLQSYVDAGLRGLAPEIMTAMADLIRQRNHQAVLKALEWMRGREARLNIDLSELTEEQLERIADGEDPISVLANPSTG